MKFSKDDTLCMKGIAILILFFHHNYLGPDRWLNSPISFYPFSQSQIMYIAKFLKICVGIFPRIFNWIWHVSICEDEKFR